MKHNGDLTITSDNAHEYAALTSVGGSLFVQAKCSLPALTYVGCDLFVRAECSLPALTYVGCDLFVRAECSLPALTYVGCNLYVTANVETPYGELLCVDEYGLFRTAAGTYHAGCRQGLTAEQALAHWSRKDERAKLFTKAIKKAEKAANQKG